MHFSFSSIFREGFTFSILSTITVEPELVRTFWQSAALWQWAGSLVGDTFLISRCREERHDTNNLDVFQGPTVSSTSSVTTSDRGRRLSSKSAGNTSSPHCHWSVREPILGYSPDMQMTLVCTSQVHEMIVNSLKESEHMGPVPAELVSSNI